MGIAPQDAQYHVFPHLAIEEAPDPPVPEEVNLATLEWMPYYGDKFRDSAFGATASLAGKGAAHMLWWHAFKQPGVCLPNDERILAHVCGLKWTDKEWKEIKHEALDQFQICSNGRLYHPFISEVALESWSKKDRYSAAGKKAAKARWDAMAMRSHSDGNTTAMRSDAIHATIQDNTIQDTIEVPKGTLSGTKPRPRPKAPVKEIIEYLNKTAGTNFSPSTKATINMLNARWQESKNIKRYKLVIDYLCSKWLKDDQMAGYLRPATIFQASKFEGYAEDGIRWADKTGYTLEENE